MTTQQEPHYKCLIFLSMLYISIMICNILLAHKLVNLGWSFAAGSSLVFSAWFTLSDVITEVYGYRISRNMLWSGIACQFIISLICTGITHLKGPLFWHSQYAYDTVLGDLLHTTLSMVVALVIGGYVNVWIITKWKALVQGRYFWLRSLGSSTIGEGIFAVLAAFFIWHGSTHPYSYIMTIIAWSYAFKVAYSCILAYPATLAVQLLRHVEKIEPTHYALDPRHANTTET